MGQTLTRSHFQGSAKIPGWAGLVYFDTLTGGSSSASSVKRARSGANFKTSSLPGPAELADIEATLQWDPESVSALVRFLGPRQGRISGCEVFRHELAADRSPNGQRTPKRWPSCTFQEIVEPDVDSDTDDQAMVTLRFAVNDQPVW